MSFDPDRVTTVTVDSYGTLVDPSAVETALAEHVEETTTISNHWRNRSLMYTMVSNEIGAYQPFYDMNRDALTHALETHGADLDDETVEDILSTYHELRVFDDVRAGLSQIVDAGYEVYVLSNGNPAMLNSMVDHAHIGDLITDTISADELKTFKPAVELYQHAAARTGTPIAEVAHVSGPTFDVQGAMNAGMQGVWLNRDNRPWDKFAPAPSTTIRSFHDLAVHLPE